MKFKNLILFAFLITNFLPKSFSQECISDFASYDGTIQLILGANQNKNVKLFDANIEIVWGCDPWNGSPCNDEEIVSGLEAGVYYLSFESATCSEWLPIEVEGGGPTPTCSDGIQNQGETEVDCGGPCEPCVTSACNVAVSSENGNVIVTGLISSANTKLFDANIASVWECNPWNGTPCSGNETITGLTTGSTYFLSVQSEVCAEWIPIVVVGESTCPDADGDGVCDEVDCNPEDPNFPGDPGAPCDDFNELTENDVVVADGCSCAGVVIEPTECDVNIISIDGVAVITGLPTDANAKLFDSAFNVAWSCDPWNGNVCSPNETTGTLNVGSVYYLSVQSASCDLWLPVTIVGGEDGDACSEFLGNFEEINCYEFLEDGSLRIITTDANGQSVRHWYDNEEYGALISSTNVNLANSLALENNRIIERNAFGNTVVDVPIDPNVASLYASEGKLGPIARYEGNGYIIVGALPINDGFDPTFDTWYIYQLDGNGNLIQSNIFGEIVYSLQDYEFYGDSFYEFVGIFQISQGSTSGVMNPAKIEIYMKQYESGVISDFRKSVSVIRLNEDLQYINGETLKLNSNNATWVDIEIEEDLCDEDRYTITCETNNLDYGFEETVVERIDHGYFAPFLRSRITTSTNGEFQTYLLETNNLYQGTLQVFGSAPEGESLFPGEFTYGILNDAGEFTTEGAITFNEPPVSGLENFDGSYNFVTEENGNVTFYTTNCQGSDNGLQGFEASSSVEKSFEINNIFPNPASDEIFIKLESLVNTTTQLHIHDLTGKKIQTNTLDLEIGSNTFNLSVENFNTGIYNLSIIANNKIQSTRFVKH